MSADFDTVHALRSDVALQIARFAERLDITQLALAKQWDVPQPTLSKIVNGHTADLSLELLLRIAVRAGLRITLQTGRIAQEAGAFVAAGRLSQDRTFPSAIATGTHAALKASLRGLTPAQRIDVFLEHNQLASEWRESARAAAAPSDSPAPRNR
jgi:predicted XRE-type DNA-binding protein